MYIPEHINDMMKQRYLHIKSDGSYETPEDMLHRVAHILAKDSFQEKAFFDVMNNQDFLPNSPTLMNAGKPNGQFSACFVLPVEDSMMDIFDAIKNAAIVNQSGGGTGFSFSRLRSKGELVMSSRGTASGVLSFLNVFDAATDAVKQGGVRRGANMGILRIDHPDIEEFIMAKDDQSKLHNFNLSIGITDAFMDAVKSNRQWCLIDPHSKADKKVVMARDLWNMIIRQAWKNGEPGVVFLDEINRYNTVPDTTIEATNPCGEQPLLPFESCNLGSINLANMVFDDTSWAFDYIKLKRTTCIAVEMLNQVINKNSYPLPEIEAQSKKTRKIGLGVMGFADLLIKMHIPYDSPEAKELGEKIMDTINQCGHEMSKSHDYQNATITTIAPTGTISMLANCSSGIEPNFSWVYIRKICDEDKFVVHPILEEVLKNHNLYTDDILHRIACGESLHEMIETKHWFGPEWITSQEIAPIDHIEMQAAFQKNTDNAVSKTVNLPNEATMEDVELIFEKAFELKCKGVTVYRDGCRDGQVLSFEKKDEQKKSNNTLREKLPLDPKEITRKLKKTIDTMDKYQKETYTPEENLVPVNKEDVWKTDTGVIRKRPDEVEAVTYRKRIGCGKLYVTVGNDEDGPIEVFTNTGKIGGCPAQSEGLSRMISLALRRGVSVDDIADQLCGIRCMSTIKKGNTCVLSCPDAIGKALQEANTYTRFLEQRKERDEECRAQDIYNFEFGDTNIGYNYDDIKSDRNNKCEFGHHVDESVSKTKICPECGASLELSEGCVICKVCGYSHCG